MPSIHPGQAAENSLAVGAIRCSQSSADQAQYELRFSRQRCRTSPMASVTARR